MGKVIELLPGEHYLSTGFDGLRYLTAQLDGVGIKSKFKVGNKIFQVQHIEYYMDPPDMFMAEVIGVAT
jgi:hypothetical protein